MRPVELVRHPSDACVSSANAGGCFDDLSLTTRGARAFDPILEGPQAAAAQIFDPCPAPADDIQQAASGT